MKKIADVNKGVLVRLVTKEGRELPKVYIKDAFDRSSGRYALIDYDDISRVLYVKPHRLVSVEFTF